MKMRPVHLLWAALVGMTSVALSAEEITWSLSSDRRVVNLTNAPNLSSADLKLEGADEGVALEIVASNDAGFALRSAWPLMAGTPYQVVLETETGPRFLDVSFPAPHAKLPSVAGISPGSDVLPENLLRLHIHFDAPMARGQVARAVHLVDEDGARIPDAFLHLGVELWSSDHRRLTVLFDPGRIKRGVGPNRALGAPLKAGRRFGVSVAADMMDAYGRTLGDRHIHWFDVGPAERRAVDPNLWKIAVDHQGVHVRFDRVMDDQSVRNTISLRTETGRSVSEATFDGQVWHWFFEEAGAVDHLDFIVGPSIEDSAGNTLCGAFDVDAGTGANCTDRRIISLTALD